MIIIFYSHHLLTVRGKKLIKMPEKPKGAKWNDPPVEISDLNYKYDSSGFRKPGETQLFTMPVIGGTPRQISNIKPEKRAGQAQWVGNNNSCFFSKFK